MDCKSQIVNRKSKNPMLATLTIHLHLPACASLKEKRGRIKPLIARLRREFNVSVAEMDLQDKWDEAVIVCAMVGIGGAFLQSALQNVAKWVEGHWTDGDVWEMKIEIV
jgi:uncharacterized protein